LGGKKTDYYTEQEEKGKKSHKGEGAEAFGAVPLATDGEKGSWGPRKGKNGTKKKEEGAVKFQGKTTFRLPRGRARPQAHNDGKLGRGHARMREKRKKKAEPR